jgi:hypothetical protein
MFSFCTAVYWHSAHSVLLLAKQLHHIESPTTLLCRHGSQDAILIAAWWWIPFKYDSDTKTLITNKCTKRVLSSILTHFYMFRPCWVIFRENFFVIVTLRLHFIVEWECAVDCVLLAVQAGTAENSRLQKHRSTQSTAHSHSTIKCNVSVTITKKVLPEDDPAGPKHVAVCYDWW